MAGTLGVIGGSLVGGGGGPTPDPLRMRQSSGPISVTAGETAHTKGAWTELISSTTHTSSQLVFGAGLSQASQNSAALVDIGVGPAGSEVPVIENLPCGMATQGNSWQIPLPVEVPAGSRIAMRFQCASAGKTGSFGLSVFTDGAIQPGALRVLGYNTDTSKGIPLQLNGSWVEISASVPAAYRYLVVVPSAGAPALQNNDGSVILGVGAAGSEVERVGVGVSTTSGESIGCGTMDPSWSSSAIQRGVSAGERIAARLEGFTLVHVDCSVIGVI